MSKLSHIEDVERRAQQEQADEPKAASPDSASRDIPNSETPQPDIAASPQGDMSAEQEEEFHGLDSTQPMGAGHKALIVIAVVVVIVAILYIVNSWIHFI